MSNHSDQLKKAIDTHKENAIGQYMLLATVLNNYAPDTELGQCALDICMAQIPWHFGAPYHDKDGDPGEPTHDQTYEYKFKDQYSVHDSETFLNLYFTKNPGWVETERSETNIRKFVAGNSVADFISGNERNVEKLIGFYAEGMNVSKAFRKCNLKTPTDTYPLKPTRFQRAVKRVCNTLGLHFN